MFVFYAVLKMMTLRTEAMATGFEDAIGPLGDCLGVLRRSCAMDVQLGRPGAAFRVNRDCCG